jgi:hypothetical protein
VGPTGFTGISFIPGTERAMCAFQDGSVGIYHVIKKQMELTTKVGNQQHRPVGDHAA